MTYIIGLLKRNCKVRIIKITLFIVNLQTNTLSSLDQTFSHADPLAAQNTRVFGGRSTGSRGKTFFGKPHSSIIHHFISLFIPFLRLIPFEILCIISRLFNCTKKTIDEK